MITSDHHRRLQLAIADHFVESEPEFVAQAEAHPADPRRQALEADPVARHVQPAMQVRIVRDEFLDLGIGPVDVFRVAGQRDPAERADASAEQRAHVGRHESREIEGIRATDIESHLADVVAVVDGRDALPAEGQHRLDVHAHRLLGGIAHFFRICPLRGFPLLDRPADRQVAMHRVVRAGLVGDAIRAHAAPHQFRQDFRRIAEQRDRFRFARLRVALDARQGVIDVGRLLIDILRAQAEIDARLPAFDGQRTRTGQRCRQRLRAAHPAEAGSEDPPALQRAAIMLPAHLHEGLVGALHDALRADVDPRAGGHLAVHHQALSIELVEMLPICPMRHQVRIGDEHTRRIGMGREHADRLARLHQQRLVVAERLQRVEDGVITGPVARGATDAAIHHQVFGFFRDFRVQVVLQHAERRFGEPASATQGVAARRADHSRRIMAPRIVAIRHGGPRMKTGPHYRNSSAARLPARPMARLTHQCVSTRRDRVCARHRGW